MLKKIILIIISLFLIACSSIEEIPKKDLVSSKNETIKLAITTPEREVILLGENYDYQFTGEEARKILTLIDFGKIDNLASQVQKKIEVNQNGIAELSIQTKFQIYKDNKSMISEKDKEKTVREFKKMLEEKNIEYSMKENENSWSFDLPNKINIKGKVTKLKNHDEILKKFSSQTINLPIDLEEYNLLSNTQYAGRVVKEKAKGVGEGILFVAVLPVAFVIGIITLPAWIYGATH
ncbi:endonuclease [Fusobacterium polymorphum]|uniref:endonuclease n=1 Tax=Fusobacterium nucleatum subsp. polymorphum TaxID=76857 RepID=UPI003009F4FD